MAFRVLDLSENAVWLVTMHSDIMIQHNGMAPIKLLPNYFFFSFYIQGAAEITPTF